MGLLGSPKKPMVIPFVLNRNGQAITLKKELASKGIKTPQAIKPLVDEAKKAGTPMTFAMTFPPGTHAMWTRYWLGAGGINPDKDVTLITIPPPQMVANMKVGKMDGFCVGEPWNARAIADGIGYTAVTTQQMWKDHPEKVLAFTEEFAEKNPKTVKAILRAMFESSQHIDKIENRAHMAEVVSRPQYINTQKEVILGRMLGDYDTGNSQALMKSAPDPIVEINRADARQFGIQDADFVEIISRRGKVMVQARVTEEIAPGTCFLPFHWGRQYGFFKAANNLTITARDPISHQPELKACAVRVRKVLDFPVGDN
jgi:ABC-type nitrate/sulfonate/bicarbonate transport system substrate-binding protein